MRGYIVVILVVIKSVFGLLDFSEAINRSDSKITYLKLGIQVGCAKVNVRFAFGSKIINV